MGLAITIIIGILLLAGVIALQQKAYFSLKERAAALSKIFPEEPEFYSVQENDAIHVRYTDIDGDGESGNEAAREYRELIFGSLGKYTENSRGGLVEYSVVRDVVERNCDLAENHARELIPVPLYLGLGGTMSGIIIGVVHLWLSGGLSGLLGTVREARPDASSIDALLLGIGIAMIASLSGVVLTILSQKVVRDASEKNGRRRNAFYTWVQTSVLPRMSSGFVSSLNQLTKTLSAHAMNFYAIGQELSKVQSVSENLEVAFRGLEHGQLMEVVEANREAFGEFRKTMPQFKRFAETTISTVERFDKLATTVMTLENRYERLEQVLDYFMRERTNQDKISGTLHVAHENQMKILEDAYRAQERVIQDGRGHLADALNEHKEMVAAQLRSLREETGDFDAVRRSLAAIGGQLQRIEQLNISLKEIEGVVRYGNGQMVNLGQLSGDVDTLSQRMDHLSNQIETIARRPIGFWQRLLSGSRSKGAEKSEPSPKHEAKKEKEKSKKQTPPAPPAPMPENTSQPVAETPEAANEKQGE